jgi:1-acyl-sn-glycerol-3-phosphate acyltransferase
VGRPIASPPALIGSPRPSLSYLAISYLLVFPIFRWLLRGRTAGNANVPTQGALVVVANHGSHLDPPLLGHALGRPVAFMAKEELFRVPLLGPIIRACGAYPVARGASDRDAIRVACQRLAEGWATGVFLDGTRQRNGRVNAPLHGAALLAARCSCRWRSSTATGLSDRSKAGCGWCPCTFESGIPSHPRPPAAAKIWKAPPEPVRRRSTA